MIETAIIIILSPLALAAATVTVCIAIGIVKSLWQFFKKKK